MKTKLVKRGIKNIFLLTLIGVIAGVIMGGCGKDPEPVLTPSLSYADTTLYKSGAEISFSPIVKDLPSGVKTYSFTTPPLDSGIILNTSTGVITIGSNVAVGEYTLKVTLNVTGHDDAISSEDITVTILEIPTITYIADTTLLYNKTIILTPAVAHLPDGDKTYSLNTTPSNTGIEIDASTGVITIGNNVVAGEYTLKVTLNVAGHSDAILSENITVTILALPTITYDANTITDFGVIKTLTPVVAHLPDGDKTYSFTTTPSDAGIEINTSTGVITIGDAVELGDYTLEITLNITGYDDAISSGDITVKIVSPDREAIMAFYNGITSGKDTLLNWGSEKLISEWSGITLNGNKRVKELELSHRDFTGTLSPRLGDLTELLLLKLQNNKFTGGIPAEIGILTKLRYLYLSNNELSGSIPEQLGNCTKLFELGLIANNLSGSIPGELGNCLVLTQLYLKENNFSGTLDPDLNKLVNLTHLSIHNNPGLIGDSPAKWCSVPAYDISGTGLNPCP